MNSCTKHSMLLAALLGVSAAAFAQTAGIDTAGTVAMPSTSAAMSPKVALACAGAQAIGHPPWPSRNATLTW
jgi:hypothetical protein